jgi:hypothetical protein
VGISGGTTGVTGPSMLLRVAATAGLAALMWTGVGYSVADLNGGATLGESIAADGSVALAANSWTSSGAVEVAATNVWTELALGALGVAAGGGLLLARRSRVAD